MPDQLSEETEEQPQNIILDKKIFEFTEQEYIGTDEQAIFESLKIPFSPTDYEGTPKFLGLSSEWTSYYIGASWLTEDRAVVVTPKKIGQNENQETDFIKMFLCALEFSPSAEYFSKFYGIDFDQPQIETDAFSEQLTPLLIVHYLWCLNKVVSRGLKKDYVIREENLKSKVRGRIMMQKNLQKNIFPQRMDRVYCKFQEYTVDIPENRLLKKALSFSENFLNKLVSINYHSSLGELKRQINQVKTSFSQVSDEIEIYEIKALRKNKLFNDYSNAIKMAKMILQRFDYSISKSTSLQKSVPPFWIDMSRLFEVYVYSKLHKAYGDKVLFQVPGCLRTVADFVKTDEKLILDAKYKTHYQKKNSAILADIRELSAYARDNKILRTMGVEKKAYNEEETLINCIIIYPEYKEIEIDDDMDDDEKREIKDFNENENKNKNEVIFNSPVLDLDNVHEIPGFRKFYKLCVNLPVKKSNISNTQQETQ